MLLPKKVCGSLIFKEVVIWLILALCGLSKCNQQITTSTMLTSLSTMDVQVQDEIRGYLRVSALLSVVYPHSYFSRVVSQTAPTLVCLQSRNINNEINRSCLETTVAEQEDLLPEHFRNEIIRSYHSVQFPMSANISEVLSLIVETPRQSSLLFAGPRPYEVYSANLPLIFSNGTANVTSTISFTANLTTISTRHRPQTIVCSLVLTCSAKNFGYYCLDSCPAETTNCNRNRRPCSPSPCIAGNTIRCREVNRSDYTCQCRPGYSGKNCETAGRPCSSSPCIAGNTLRCTEVSVIHYTCQCRSGYRGRNCQTAILPCDRFPCTSTFTRRCVNVGQDYKCLCIHGYRGKTCGFPISTLSTSTVSNENDADNSFLTVVVLPPVIGIIVGVIIAVIIIIKCRNKGHIRTRARNNRSAIPLPPSRTATSRLMWETPSQPRYSPNTTRLTPSAPSPPVLLPRPDLSEPTSMESRPASVQPPEYDDYWRDSRPKPIDVVEGESEMPPAYETVATDETAPPPDYP